MSSPEKPNVAVAMLGARMHYAVPRILAEAGLLERFFTDSYVGNKPLFSALLRLLKHAGGGNFAVRWLDRNDPRLPPRKVTSFESLGIRYALDRRHASKTAELDAVYAETNARFSKAILRRGLGASDTVWGFNTASVELFRTAKSEGRRCILEQTILPKRLEAELLRKVALDWVGWQPGFDPLQDHSLLAERETEEWALADLIVAGSEFVADGLVECGVERTKISVIPYGVDPERFPPPQTARSAEGPLRVLFVGEVGLRKGAPYLLEALQTLGPEKVQARFAGRISLDPALLAPFGEVAEFLGAVPRQDMPHLYKWAQVFILPSIVEGSATASYEALMAGLPVVATPNTGTIVRDGVEGRIVSARNTSAIADTLSDYINNPDLLDLHGKNAFAAQDRISLERYGRDIVALFK